MRGIEIFKQRFEVHKDKYVLIGGAACDVLFSKEGVAFRGTRALDVVLLVEAIDPAFGEAFWKFIQDGQYENKVKSSGKPQFYRFGNPARDEYPLMIELFSRTDEMFLKNQQEQLMPIHIDDEVSSLSAILLNQD